MRRVEVPLVNYFLPAVLQKSSFSILPKSDGSLSYILYISANPLAAPTRYELQHPH